MKKNLIAFIFGVSTVIGSLFLFNIFFSIKEQSSDQAVREIAKGGQATYFHSKIGLHLFHNTEFSIIKTLGNKQVLNYQVNTDEYGRRINPSRESERRSDYHAIFFGGSFTMGEGVQNNETFPAYFEGQNSTFKSYNYGYRGYGPQQMLAFLEYEKVNEQVPEKKGVVVYTWSTDHLYRVAGLPTVIQWAKTWPYYKLNKDNRPIYRGFFDQDRWLLTKFYLFLNSRIGTILGLNNLVKVEEKEINLMCNMIVSARDKVKEQLPDSVFFSSILPFWIDDRIYEKVSECLSRHHVNEVDLRDIFKGHEKDKVQIKDDGHATAFGNELIAKELSVKIKNYFP